MPWILLAEGNISFFLYHEFMALSVPLAIIRQLPPLPGLPLLEPSFTPIAGHFSRRIQPHVSLDFLKVPNPAGPEPLPPIPLSPVQNRQTAQKRKRCQTEFDLGEQIPLDEIDFSKVLGVEEVLKG